MLGRAAPQHLCRTRERLLLGLGQRQPVHWIINSKGYPAAINKSQRHWAGRCREGTAACKHPGQERQETPQCPRETPSPRPTCFKHFSFSFSMVVSSVTSSSHSVPSTVQTCIFNTLPAKIFSSWTNMTAAFGLRSTGPVTPERSGGCVLRGGLAG